MANNLHKKEVLGRIGRVEREDRLKKIVRNSTIVVLIIIGAVLIYGIATEFFIFPNQPIATVDGEIIYTKDFQAKIKFERRNLINTFSNWYNYYYQAVQTGDEFTSSYSLNEMERIQAQLDVDSLGLTALNTMIEDVIIRHEADRLGIIVTDEEIEERTQFLFDYFPNGSPTPIVYPTTAPTSTLTAQQLLIATVVPTATVPATEVVATEDSPTPTDEVEEVVVQPTAVPTEYTLDAYQEDFDNFLESVKAINFSAEDLVNYISAIIYREKLSETLTADLPRVQEQVWARHILVETEEEAVDLYDQIMDGEDFAELAAEFSIDISNASQGGDLGWFGRDTMVPEFSTAAFDTLIGEVSEPVETSFGFHLIQVVGHEERPLSSSSYLQLQLIEFNNWLIEKVIEADIQVEDYWTNRIPNEPALPAEIDLGQ